MSFRKILTQLGHGDSSKYEGRSFAPSIGLAAKTTLEGRGNTVSVNN